MSFIQLGVDGEVQELRRGEEGLAGQPAGRDDVPHVIERFIGHELVRLVGEERPAGAGVGLLLELGQERRRHGGAVGHVEGELDHGDRGVAEDRVDGGRVPEGVPLGAVVPRRRRDRGRVEVALDVDGSPHPDDLADLRGQVRVFGKEVRERREGAGDQERHARRTVVEELLEEQVSVGERRPVRVRSVAGERRHLAHLHAVAAVGPGEGVPAAGAAQAHRQIRIADVALHLPGGLHGCRVDAVGVDDDGAEEIDAGHGLQQELRHVLVDGRVVYEDDVHE